MKPIKLLFVCLGAVLFSSKASAQLTNIKSIEYASFDINSPRIAEKNKLIVNTYYRVDMKGNMIVTEYNPDRGKTTYSLYRVPVTFFNQINTTFKPGKKMKNYMVRKRLKSGQIFGGNYEYFVVEYNNGVKDSLCFVKTFMSNSFSKITEMLDELSYSENGRIVAKPFAVPENFRKSLLQEYYKSKYLPKIKFPGME